MRSIKNTIFWVAIYSAFVMLWSYLALGCSATKLHDRSIQKGYVHSIHIDTVKIASIDTLWIEGKAYPVISYKDSLIYQVNTEYVPKWRYRFDSRRFGDSLAHIRAMYSDSLRNALKTQKIEVKHDIKKKKQETRVIQSENKNGFADTMKWIAIVIFLLMIAFLLFRYAPKTPVE